MPKVINKHFKQICLESGVIQPDEVGEATDAEYSTLAQYLEKVELKIEQVEQTEQVELKIPAATSTVSKKA